jgi:hypothetical protein
VIENVKDRFDGDDDDATRADQAVGYSSETAEGIEDAVAATAEPGRSSAEDG